MCKIYNTNKYKIIHDNKVIEVNNEDFHKKNQSINISEIANKILGFLNLDAQEDNKFSLEKSSSKTFSIISRRDQCFPISILKNSGLTNNLSSKTNKRIAITEKYYKLVNLKFSKIYPIAVTLISSNNNYSDYVYFLVENSKNFINNYVEEFSNKKFIDSKKKKSYSSLWLNDWDAFEKCSLNKNRHNGVFASNYNKKGNLQRKYFITSSLNKLVAKMKNIDYDSNFYETTTEEKRLTNSEEKIQKYSKNSKFNEHFDIEIKSFSKIKRNKDMIDVYLQEINHQRCENCTQTKTFTMQSGKEYFEVHHFIPCNITVQKQYFNRLDNYKNLISLCPNCHRMIHFVERNTRKILLENLFNKKFSNNDFLLIFPEFDLEKLCEQYDQTFKLPNKY